MARYASKSTKKILLYASIGVLLMALGFLGYLFIAKQGPFSQSDPSSSSNYGPATQEEITAGEEIKKNAEKTGGSDPSPQPTPGEGGSRPQVTMEITAANQDSGTLYIRTLIQTVTSSGTCRLTMSGPSGKSYQASAGVQAMPSTSTCNGFNVPVDGLSPGDWVIDISFENDSVEAAGTKGVVIR